MQITRRSHLFTAMLRISPLVFFVLALSAGTAFAQPAATALESISATERGRAVRYDTGATGQRTASGEPYNPERMTLAHSVLPFGTLVQLTNDTNGQTVWARVNDRLPPEESPRGALRVRVSARTADQLGLGARGGDVVLRLDEDEVAFLRVRAMQERARARAVTETASIPPASAVRGFTVQLASFADEGRAAAKAGELRGAWVLPVTVDGARVYRVCYGVFPTAESAATGEARLQARGIDGFVKSLDAPPARSASLDTDS